MVDLMRFTVIDERGAVTFVAAPSSLETMVAVCAQNPRDFNAWLGAVGRFEPAVEEYVSSGLAVFDEHNLKGHYEAIHSALRFLRPQELPPFRVVDALTREASLGQVRAGIVIFNLPARRIVQLQNTYQAIRRKGRVVVGAGTSRKVLRYELPASWTIVP
ncbi:MAG: hypothetical protein ACYC4L_07970 [Chloroflexota bacterium]